MELILSFFTAWSSSTRSLGHNINLLLLPVQYHQPLLPLPLLLALPLAPLPRFPPTLLLLWPLSTWGLVELSQAENYATCCLVEWGSGKWAQRHTLYTTSIQLKLFVRFWMGPGRYFRTSTFAPIDRQAIPACLIHLASAKGAIKLYIPNNAATTYHLQWAKKTCS